jgi:penicillin-binding protein 1A
MTHSLLRALARLSVAVVLMVATAALLAAPAVPVLVASADVVEASSSQLLDAPPLPDELPVAAQLSTVHDREGARIAELAGEIRREPVPLEEIPDVVIDAVLATEDSGFFEHRGVEHDAMLRAAGRNLAAGGIAEGASTITQQYVKMTLLSPEQTIERKIQEVLLAVELERRDSKEEILEGYLNAIYLGEGVYGVNSAADHYFSKPLDELTVAEAATLAGSIQAPAVTNPVANEEAAKARRDIVIRQMVAQDRIDRETADEALASDIELDIRNRDFGEPFWIDTVKRLIYDPEAALQPGLQEAVGESVGERVDAIFEGGLRIETTLDRRLMDAAGAAIGGYLTDATAHPMGALISVEHQTGALRVFALGPHDFGTCDPDSDEPCALTTTNPTVPWGGGSGRQSGSAFKPFVAAAAFEDGLDRRPVEVGADLLEAAPRSDDEDDDAIEDALEDATSGSRDGTVRLDPLSYPSPSGREIEGCGTADEPYEPSNYGGSDFGVIGIGEAMQRSVNTYFVQLARDVGVERVAELAQEHGMRWGNLDTFGSVSCSIGLGSAEVFPLGMTMGYGTWTNGGVRCEPYVIERILDRDGEVVYEHEPRCERVVDLETARKLRDILRGPVQAGGTAGSVGARLGSGVFGKTGTTNSNVDAWFVGAYGDLTTSAWVGFEQPRPMEGLTLGGTTYRSITGGTVPASIWTDYVAATD